MWLKHWNQNETNSPIRHVECFLLQLIDVSQCLPVWTALRSVCQPDSSGYPWCPHHLCAIKTRIVPLMQWRHRNSFSFCLPQVNPAPISHAPHLLPGNLINCHMIHQLFSFRCLFFQTFWSNPEWRSHFFLLNCSFSTLDVSLFIKM